jgi:hypothetical protein
MENVNAVEISVGYNPLICNGQVRVKIVSTDFADLLVVFASAMYRNSDLRILVKQSIEFLASNEFKDIAQQEGL